MVFLKSFSVFLGTIIGVGIFGLPFIALKAGFFVVLFYFLFMALAAVLIHIFYGKVAAGSEGNHRLPGYVNEYLGEKWKKFAFFIRSVSLIGALLAYLIVGGKFLFLFFAPFFGGNLILYTLIFFVLGAYLIFRGIKAISQIELFLLFVLFAIIGVLFLKSFSIINFDYLKVVNFKFLFFPYGVVLFSLWGTAVIPEIKEMLARAGTIDVEKKLERVFFWGIIAAVFFYLSFVFIILGVSGSDTSKEAISGLTPYLGINIIKLAFLFGLISCFTSFLTLGLSLKKMFWYDLSFSKNFSWFITCFSPLILFLLGIREFIGIIGFVGAVSIGLEALIIIFLYRQFLKDKFSKKMNPVFYLLALIFILGVFFEIVPMI